jgi:transcriptional regulator with XRE-family HTH domain
MNVSVEFKQKVREDILHDFENSGLNQKQYSKRLNINSSVFSRFKKGEIENILPDGFFIRAGRELGVSLNQRKWNIARTSVYEEIEENIKFCIEYKKATILIDEPGIGKSFCTRHIIKNTKNAFYIDCSQAKKEREFIRHLAKILGIGEEGKLDDLKKDIKYCINLLQPFIALDDAGYLDNNVYILIIELWNATEGNAGWMMIGDDSLQASLEKGLKNKKRGYKALFSRFSEEFIHYVPIGSQDRQQFISDLIGDVAMANTDDKKQINKYIKLCLRKGKTLRHLDTLLKLPQE